MPQPKDTAKETGNKDQATDLPPRIEAKLKSGKLNFLEPIATENTKWVKTYESFVRDRKRRK